MPSSLSADEPSPAVVVDRALAALNSGDLDGALASFADEVKLAGRFRGSGKGPLRSVLGRHIQQRGSIDVAPYSTRGNRVEWASHVSRRDWAENGRGSMNTVDEAVIEHGRIVFWESRFSYAPFLRSATFEPLERSLPPEPT